MSDIISELRVPTMCYDMAGKCYTQSTMEEAADYIEKLEAKLAAAEADIERLVSEAVEREALFQAEREKVRVLREALEYAVKQVPEIGTVPGVKEAFATTEPEDV